MERDRVIQELKGIDITTDKGKTYRVGDKLGDGGGGAVFHLISNDKTDLAVKFYIPPRNRQGDENATLRFKNEIEVGRHAKHVYVIQTLDTGITTHCQGLEIPFYVMPLAKSSLRQLVPDDYDPEGLDVRLLILIRAMLGVAYFHKDGSFHRDLKPENILIFGEEHPRVSDFGIAHIDPRFIGKSKADVVTDLNERLMNRRYFAPEQAEKGVNVDRRADIFSLGLILYELIAGRDSFRVSRPDLSSLDAGLGGFDRIIFKKMAINDRNERYDNLGQGIGDILWALGNFVASRNSYLVTQEDKDRLRQYLRSTNKAMQDKAVELARRVGPEIALPIANEFVGPNVPHDPTHPEQNAFRIMGELRDESSLPVLVCGLYGYRDITAQTNYANAKHAANALRRFPVLDRIKALDLVKEKVLALHIEIVVSDAPQEQAFQAVKRLYDLKLLDFQKDFSLAEMHRPVQLLFKIDPDKTWDMHKPEVLRVERNVLADQFIQFGNIQQVEEIRAHILEDEQYDYYPRLMEGILRSELPGRALVPEFRRFLGQASKRLARQPRGRWKDVADQVKLRLEEIERKQ